jgi:hypothetical protein
MAVHRFTIVVDRVPTDEQEDAIFSRFDDLGVGASPREGIGYVTVDRRTGSLSAAIESAVRDVESVGLHPMRIDDENDVTLGEIAGRIRRSREIVRLWSIGRQGPGGFPPPMNIGGPTTLYSWAEVSVWLRERMGFEIPEVDPVLVAANLALQIRTLAPRIKHTDVDAIRRLAAA